MGRAVWERELEFLRRNLHRYLEHWPAGQEGWRPAASAYPLLGLAEHLYGSPAWYMDVVEGGNGETGLQVEGEGPAATEALGAALDAGMARVQRMLDETPEDAFAARRVPWPFGDPMTAEGVVLSLVTHMYHHRGQMHLYLKQLGRPVDTDTVYGS